jgi:tRNA-2-methylthio-N6-dimethylallyladenosine synthase
MNAHDSERIKGMLEDIGLGEAAAAEDADVLVFNTCTIREKPDTRLAAHLGHAKALKDADADRVIAVGGCYAEAQRERIFTQYPFVDVAFGPGSIPHLGDWLGAGGYGVARSAFGSAEERRFSATLPTHRDRRFQALVPRFVDRAHPALAEQADDTVAALQQCATLEHGYSCANA